MTGCATQHHGKEGFPACSTTATVTAISRLHVWILDREEFLAAVTGSPESVQSADAVVSARLQVG